MNPFQAPTGEPIQYADVFLGRDCGFYYYTDNTLYLSGSCESVKWSHFIDLKEFYGIERPTIVALPGGVLTYLEHQTSGRFFTRLLDKITNPDQRTICDIEIKTQ